MFTTKVACAIGGNKSILLEHIKLLNNLRCCRTSRSSSHVISNGDTMPAKIPALNSSELHNKHYNFWKKNDYFFHDERNNSKSSSPFVVMLPPPNITGTLHLGHALTSTVQDAIVRWHGMRGYETLWVPGCDHAGIATQVILEKHLFDTQGLSRHQMTRKEFEDQAWSWKAGKEKRIYEQLQRLGTALNWEKAVFTLDDKMNKAVTEAFVKLFDKGLIYRKDRFVHYCTVLQSVIADMEVVNKHLPIPTPINVPGYDQPVVFGEIYDISYPILQNESTTSEHITVSTTSPETIPADSAIMVHPDDDRYSHLIGRKVLNLYREGIEMPIIADTAVDPKKGTGAVKVTPAHSEVDYAVGLRHDLPSVDIFNDDGTIKNIVPDFAGLHRYEARDRILKDLQLRNLLIAKRPYPMTLHLCSRTNDILVPLIKKQWYVKVKSMMDRALEAVDSGELSIHPEGQWRVWVEWMKKSRNDDWCISRQLWWGHQIPAYRIEGSSDQWVAARSQEEALDKAAEKLNLLKSSITVTRDCDVLDTWFSSGLFPFSTLGWPDDTQDLAKYYPNSQLITGQDILFFWVARMVMLGTELTGTLPFKKVLLHALVTDGAGQKMSKSKGNVVDPIAIIGGDQSDDDGVGADVLRMTLLSQDISSDYISFDKEMLNGFKLLTNKMWQTLRFLRFNCERSGIESLIQLSDIPSSRLSNVDRWILHKTSQLVSSAAVAYDTQSLNLLVNLFVKFWRTQLCDVYIETLKVPRVEDGLDNTQVIPFSILGHCIFTALKTIAPVMPYLTEEMYQWVPLATKRSIFAEEYPSEEEFHLYNDSTVSDEVTVWLKALSAFRALKVSANVTAKNTQGSIILPSAMVTSQVTEEMKTITCHLAKLSDISVHARLRESDCAEDEGWVTSTAGESVVVAIRLEGSVDVNKELERLSKKSVKLRRTVDKWEKKRNQKEGNLENAILELEQLRKMINILHKIKN